MLRVALVITGAGTVHVHFNDRTHGVALGQDSVTLGEDVGD